VNPTLSSVLTAILWAVIGGGLVWLVTLPLRRRSLSGLLASVVLTGTAASVAAVLGSVREMLLPMHEQTKAVVVAVIAGLIAAVTAGVAARRLVNDNEVLRDAIADLGRGHVADHGGGRRLSAELEATRRQLSETASVLAESRERERALEASRRELVAWVSHDLRTPLAGLRAMSEALEDGMVDDPELYYKQIAASVDRLGGMVDDLFDLSRLQAGTYAHDMENISLDDLVSDCLAALEPLATAQQVRLTGSVTAPAAVTGSVPELNRALTNLVANAIRHTRAEGHVDVRVGLTSVGAESVAEVVVHDQCGGIAPDDLARVFDVGYRGESARTPHSANPAGAGLGLAITRGIIAAHDGTVDVENADDGCRFRLLLPVAG
jgi:signal transduction histidine kinase